MNTNSSSLGSLATIGAILISLIALITSLIHTSDPSVARNIADIQQEISQLSTHSGALAGPDIASPYLNWGGIVRWGAVQAFNQASSTLCSIQAPAATSTLRSFGINFTAGAVYANTYELGYSATTKNSTSTAIIASYTVAANALLTTQATTTLTALTDGVVAPNSWVSFNVSTTTVGSATGPTATGQCSATFDQLQNPL
jgi:hypothetical protein